MRKNLSTPAIQSIKGIGPQRAKLLARLGIRTPRDALFYLPYRYEDRSNIKRIIDLACGYSETVSGKVLSSRILRPSGRRLGIFELTVGDETGTLKAKWFHQPFLQKTFTSGMEVLLYGTVRRNSYTGRGFEMDNPEYELITHGEDSFLHMHRIVPVYRVTSGFSVRQMRSFIHLVVNAFAKDVQDPIPEEILGRYHLPGLSESLRRIHFPESGDSIELLNTGTDDFHRRLSFEELFSLELGLAALKNESERQKGISFSGEGTLLNSLLRELPFTLTAAQRKVWREILNDMKAPFPMHRLVQGDVGCGKTVIALMAMIVAVESGYQSALMAPTELLAEQHYITISRLAGNLGLNVCLLTGSRRERPLDDISSGGIDIVVGTHALIQEGVSFKNLGLAVIDEQHRFGVIQRSLLRKKASSPDVLVMTATPIPRTLALTLYGDLDCSVIDEIPPGRKPVTTLRMDASQKESIYRLIREEIRKGRQAYVVYPVIEGDEDSDLRSATLGKRAFEKYFPELRIGLIHGKMKPDEREQVMETFQRGLLDILVTTTVIEVGVDVPNASLMIIIHAERFGLSQLHQLRGRIGRGSHRSFCVLVAYEPCGEEARRRLEIMGMSNNGFQIAEEDLNIRGPGEFFGTRQSGIPDLRIADILRDASLLVQARKEAFALVDRDPGLTGYPLLRKSVETLWEGRIGIFKTA